MALTPLLPVGLVKRELLQLAQVVFVLSEARRNFVLDDQKEIRAAPDEIWTFPGCAVSRANDVLSFPSNCVEVGCVANLIRTHFEHASQHISERTGQGDLAQPFG
ncbi:hypothetical protein D3C86_1770580 [compost metagenome]